MWREQPDKARRDGVSQMGQHVGMLRGMGQLRSLQASCRDGAEEDLYGLGPPWGRQPGSNTLESAWATARGVDGGMKMKIRRPATQAVTGG